MHNPVLDVETSSPSTCSMPGPTPSTVQGASSYDAYTIVNTTGSAECVTATIRPGTGNYRGVKAFGYLGSFDPSSPQTNYIGTSGYANCAMNTPQTSFAFGVPAGGQYVLAVDDCYGYPYQARFAIDIAVGGPPTGVKLLSAAARRGSRGVLVRWRTAWESRTLGFNVYRERDGSSTRVNPKLIPSAFGVTRRGVTYSWLDGNAPGGRLKYRIQAVGLDGKRSWIGLAETR